MNNRYLIDGSFKSNSFIAPLFATLLVTAAAVVMKLIEGQGSWPGYLVATIITAGVLAVISVWAAVDVINRRRWLEVEPEAFALVSRTGRKVYADNEVISLAHFATKNHANGEFKSITHNLTLWLAGTPTFDVVKMQHTSSIKKPDEFGQFIQRIWKPLVSMASALLNEGKPVVGEGWRLDRTTFTAKVKNAPDLTLPVDGISGVFTVDGNVSIWRKGDEKPCWKVSDKTVNASILLELLSGIIDARGSSGDEPDLGNILFERKTMTLLANCICYGLAAAAAVCGYAIYSDVPAAGIICTGIGMAIAAGTWICRNDVLRCHARGVFRKHFGRERQLRYNEVASFSYSATRMYHNGLYTGTSISMKFAPRNEVGAKPIKYSTSVRNEDEGLNILRDHVSSVVASGMSKELAANGSVKWTANMQFIKDGLQVRPSKLIGRAEPQLIPFSEIVNFDILEGTFHLWIKGKDKSVMQETMAAENFFPGYFLLASMFSRGAAPEAKA